nr:unnamed protein product [Spirometra erinaceieuropaei]
MLTNLPVAAAADADEETSVENRWCQLSDTVQSIALAVPGRDLCRGLQARLSPTRGSSDGALPGDVASRRSPQDLNDGTIVHLYRLKGNRQLGGNHRGISSLNIAGTIFTRIFLSRFNNHLERGLLFGNQYGFNRHRGTTDMIFAARQLQEKCQEMRTHLYSTFVDLTKAVDTVNRDGLWKIMQKFSCLERFARMVRQFHNGMTARVTDGIRSNQRNGAVMCPGVHPLLRPTDGRLP